MDRPYRPRILDATIDELLTAFPAVMVVGPRACGKTTTARRFARTVVRLDREVEAMPLRDDPDAVLRSLETPALLDEWQMVPEVLGSVKRAVDDEVGTRRFILTGSVRAELLEATWAATGRVVRVTQWGMTRRELEGDIRAPSFFDRVFGGDLSSLRAPPDPPDLAGYVDLALHGGYPDVALSESRAVNQRWLRAYVDLMVLHDAVAEDEDRDPVKLRRYLEAVAAHTAGVVEHQTLFDAAGVSRVTAAAYDTRLELLFLTERIPAWHSNRLKRLTRRPKRYVTDPALLGPLLGVSPQSVLRNGDMLGRVIDTFVLFQLRPELEAATTLPRVHHLRLQNARHECDLIVEAPDSRVIGIEIKSTAAPRAADARHLAWLRDELGERFVAGILFHTGPRPFSLGSKIQALPIASLWGPAD